jgi:putative transcriptional regulator
MDQSNENSRFEEPINMSHPEEIRALRKRMRLTQRQFAGWFGFPVATLRHWERGNRTPQGSSLVLLTVIREHPRIVIVAVRKARQRAVQRLGKIEPPKGYRAPPGFSDEAQYRSGKVGRPRLYRRRRRPHVID